MPERRARGHKLRLRDAHAHLGAGPLRSQAARFAVRSSKRLDERLAGSAVADDAVGAAVVTGAAGADGSVVGID